MQRLRQHIDKINATFNGYLLSKEILILRLCRVGRAITRLTQQDRSLRFSRKDRTFEVDNDFIVDSSGRDHFLCYASEFQFIPRLKPYQRKFREKRYLFSRQKVTEKIW